MGSNIEICPHLRESTLKPLNNEKINPLKCSFHHKEIENESVSLWTCFECLRTGCSRYSTNKCMENHFEREKHPLAFNFEDSLIWCYKCDKELIEIYHQIDDSTDNQLEKNFSKLCEKFLLINHRFKKEYSKKPTNDNLNDKFSIEKSKQPNSENVKNKDFFKENDKKKFSIQNDRVFGLQNLGNTCFFNSITQVILNSKSFITTLQNDIKELPNKGLAKEIFNIYNRSLENEKVLNPKSLLQELQKQKIMYSNYNQQDSHECFTSYLEILEKEYKKVSKNFKIPFFGYFTYNCVCSNCKSEEWIFEENGSIILNLNTNDLTGESESNYQFVVKEQIDLLEKRQTSHSKTYIPINNKSIRENKNIEKSGFMKENQILHVDLKNQLLISDVKNDFEELLGNYFDFKIHSSKEHGYKCDKCKKSDKSSGYFGFNKNYIINPPEILVIVLKRFKPGRFGMQKDDSKVSCGLILDLTRYCLARSSKNDASVVPPKELKYRLYGIVEHSGTISGGHYVCYVRKESGAWYYISDSHFSEVSEESIKKNKSGYLYFYEQIN